MSAMSTSSPLLVLLLAMIILCDARQLSDSDSSHSTHKEAEPVKRSHLSIKKVKSDEAVANKVVPNISSSIAIAATGLKPAALSKTAEEETMNQQQEAVREEKQLLADQHKTSTKKKKKPMRSSSNSKKNKHQTQQQHPSSSSSMSGKASVSWRVPHKPRSDHDHEHEPGFNLDYSPPKTHPPSHN